MRRTTRRRKLSTTVSADTARYLEGLIAARKAASLAEAVDLAVAEARRHEQRAKLERDTAAYFQNLSGRAANEEADLASALGKVAHEVDFDR